MRPKFLQHSWLRPTHRPEKGYKVAVYIRKQMATQCTFTLSQQLHCHIYRVDYFLLALDLNSSVLKHLHTTNARLHSHTTKRPVLTIYFADVLVLTPTEDSDLCNSILAQVVVVTFFNHNFVNCKATLILEI